jgi:hypothetical protein
MNVRQRDYCLGVFMYVFDREGELNAWIAEVAQKAIL